LLHDFINWIREDLGRFTEDGLSWSHQLHQSLFMWNIIEGTHVLTIMFFAGTIWLIDLRMLGVAFRNVPLSTLNKKVLPITMISFAVMIMTGVIAFIGRDPMMYYHNIWFRLKMVFLLVALINILWFHYKVQKSEHEWDTIPPDAEIPAKARSGPALWAFLGAIVLLLGTLPITGVDLGMIVTARMALTVVALVALFIYVDGRTPSIPRVVKLSGGISLSAWFLVIIFGRFIAYDWFYCEKTDPGSLAYVLQECAAYQDTSVEEEVFEEETVIEEEATPEGEPATDAAPEDPPPEGEAAPTAPDAEPAQPTTGQEG
jgi:hypothetical protein